MRSTADVDRAKSDNEREECMKSRKSEKEKKSVDG